MNEHLADLVVNHYERHAREWDVDRRALPWVDRPCIDLFAGPLPAGGAVLDLDCGGDDPVATSLVAHRLRVTGVESSPTLISLCRERMPAEHWGSARGAAIGTYHSGSLYRESLDAAEYQSLIEDMASNSWNMSSATSARRVRGLDREATVDRVR